MSDENRKTLEVQASWTKPPTWVAVVILIYLLLGASGGLWFGLDRVASW